MSLQRIQSRIDDLPEWVVFVAIVVVVAAYLFVFAYPRQLTRGLLINDEMWYAHLARSLAEGPRCTICASTVAR